LSFTRTAGYRLATLVKPRIVTVAPAAAAAQAADVPDLSSVARVDIVAASVDAALRDPVFLGLIATGDRHRDAGEWAAAERVYAAALASYPYQPGYWVQLGHMRKEQDAFAEAEIAYRSAAALGVAPGDVVEHLRFVMARQNVSEGDYPIRYARAGSAAEQTPTREDVLLLAKLLWQVEDMSAQDMLNLLRKSATCDMAFAQMVADPRFERSNANWLGVIQDGDL
jgi:tetratricopeptide (TPR) repeat protein